MVTDNCQTKDTDRNSLSGDQSSGRPQPRNEECAFSLSGAAGIQRCFDRKLVVKNEGQTLKKGKLMKKMKKMMALVIAMVMTLSMTSMMAFADPADPQNPSQDQPAATTTYDHPLTVTDLMAGDTVKFYKVIEWVGETSDHSDVSGWKAVSTYATVLDKDTLTAMLLGDPDADPAVAPTGVTPEIAGQLAALAQSGGVDGTIEGTTATLDNPGSGMWMALITPADANTVYNPVFVSADYNTESGGTFAATGSYDNGVAKKSTLTLTKTFENAADYNSDNGQTTAVGDTVSFTVNTTIPGYGEVYTHPHFVLTDSLTALELKENTVTLTAPTGLTKGTGTVDVLSTTADYFVETTTAGYTITFTEKYLKTVQTATAVTVTYDAEVTTDAEDAINEEDNEVKIEYSHNPNDQSDYDVKKDTTQHYTFSLDAEGLGEGASETTNGKKTSELVKIGVDAAGNPITSVTEHSEIIGSETETWSGPLQNAVFGLWKNAQCTGDAYLEATTGADGRMNFAGLDAGEYWLKEISAPDGYVTNTTIHHVVISATFDTVTVTEYWNGSEWVAEQNSDYKSATYTTDILASYTVTVDDQPTASYTFTNDTENPISSTEINWEEAAIVEHPFELENTKGLELPSTGGIGTTLFYIIGAILVLGAGIILVTRRRMSAK